MESLSMTESGKGKKILGRARCRWENIKLDITEIEWNFVDWFYLDRC
jgi:hypothetical protein